MALLGEISMDECTEQYGQWWCKACTEALNPDTYEIIETKLGPLHQSCLRNDAFFAARLATALQQPVIVWRDRSQIIPPPEVEHLYTVSELVEIMKLSDSQVTKLFVNEPGVIDLATKEHTKRLTKTRHKSALRIPHSVFERVMNRRRLQ